MSSKKLSRSGAVGRAILYTTALPIALAAVSVIYTLIVGLP